jgi:hypothetical protein
MKIAYHNCLSGRKTPESPLPVINMVNSTPVSASECEPEFSQMNLAVTPTLALLLKKPVVALCSIKLTGPSAVRVSSFAVLDSWFVKG